MLAQESTLCLLMKTSYQNRIPGHRGEVQKMVKEGPSIQRISEDLERELPRSIQEELSDQHHRRASSNIFKILTQGPLEKDFSRISTRFSHKSLYETMQRYLADLTKILSQGSVKDLDQDLHARTPKRISEDSHKGTCCWRGSCKILIQEPHKSITEELIYKHL